MRIILNNNTCTINLTSGIQISSLSFRSILRVPTVMENPGKKWSWKVMEKSWKIAKIQNVMEICLPGKKSWKSHGNQLSKSA